VLILSVQRRKKRRRGLLPTSPRKSAPVSFFTEPKNVKKGHTRVPVSWMSRERENNKKSCRRHWRVARAQVPPEEERGSADWISCISVRRGYHCGKWFFFLMLQPEHGGRRLILEGRQDVRFDLHHFVHQKGGKYLSLSLHGDVPDTTEKVGTKLRTSVPRSSRPSIEGGKWG